VTSVGDVIPYIIKLVRISFEPLSRGLLTFASEETQQTTAVLCIRNIKESFFVCKNDVICSFCIIERTYL